MQRSGYCPQDSTARRRLAIYIVCWMCTEWRTQNIMILMVRAYWWGVVLLFMRDWLNKKKPRSVQVERKYPPYCYGQNLSDLPRTKRMSSCTKRLNHLWNDGSTRLKAPEYIIVLKTVDGSVDFCSSHARRLLYLVSNRVMEISRRWLDGVSDRWLISVLGLFDLWGLLRFTHEGSCILITSKACKYKEGLGCYVL